LENLAVLHYHLVDLFVPAHAEVTLDLGGGPVEEIDASADDETLQVFLNFFGGHFQLQVLFSRDRLLHPRHSLPLLSILEASESPLDVPYLSAAHANLRAAEGVIDGFAGQNAANKELLHPLDIY